MAIPVNLPELIISLSHDHVSLAISGNEDTGRDQWAGSYPIDALFIKDQLSQVFDEALSANPSLIDHFDQVEVVVIDSPHFCLPRHYAEDERLTEIAGRYLRNRNGDQLMADQISSNNVLAYNFPQGTLDLIHEYYANAGQQHLTSILWNAIHEHISELPHNGLRLFHILKGNTLIVLGENGGKLTFTKTWIVPEKEDLHYYMFACDKLLQPAENYSVVITDEAVGLKLEEVPEFRFHHHLVLAPLSTLIARHRS